MNNEVIKSLVLIDELTVKLKDLIKEYCEGELGQMQTIYASFGYMSFFAF